MSLTQSLPTQPAKVAGPAPVCIGIPIVWGILPECPILNIPKGAVVKVKLRSKTPALAFVRIGPITRKYRLCWTGEDHKAWELRPDQELGRNSLLKAT